MRMHFTYLPLVFFISCVNAGDMPINVCNKAVRSPPQPPGGIGAIPVGDVAAAAAVQCPTINPSPCTDLDA